MKNVFFRILLLVSISSFLIVSELKAQDPFYYRPYGPLYYQEAKTWDHGIRAGFSTSMLRPEFLENTGDLKIRLSGMVGLFSRYQITDRIGIQAEIDYAERGTDYSKLKKVKLAFIDIPITLTYNVRYRLFGEDQTFDMLLGLQPSFLLSAENRDTDISSQLNPTGYDLVIGSGMPVERFLFYATNKIGLSDLNKENFGGAGFLRSITTEWTIGYRF